jgi:hypothetical protein
MGASAAPASNLAPEPDRVRQIAAMLREAPGTFGAPITNREVWDELAQREAVQETLKNARRILASPIPAFTDEDYREIVASGSRARHYSLYNRRPGTLAPLCMAECLENQGRFLPRLEELIAELCAEKTWVVPVRKQESLDNLEGKRNTIDLNKSMRAWELALADQLLADRLRPETRTMIRANLERRIFVPFRDMVAGRQKADFWLTGTNNWNAVCLAGVTGTALTILESREERAFFAATAEKLSAGFVTGFKPDGFCTEGLGYWNFGFGHYLALSEALWQATDGKLDLLAQPKVRNMALFGARIEIDGGVYPAFADCPTGSRANEMIMQFMSRRLGLGLDDWEGEDMARASGTLYQRVLYAFPNSATRVPPATERVQALEPRSYFADMGVLVCRPGPDSAAQLGIAIKGGHNGEHHNHNDVGSFAVAMGTHAPVQDVGAEVYTNRTFSSRRYESKALNSYGHPVPVVAGHLQETGGKARARVLKTDFTPEVDTFVLDLSAAYDVPDLRRLERTLVYSRAGRGHITITDTVEFATPQAFETALTTLGHCERRTPTEYVFRDGEDAVAVHIEASSAVTIAPEPLGEEIRGGGTATRLGIRCTEPVTKASVTVRIFPQSDRQEGDPLVSNGSFEDGAAGWLIPKDGMGTLSTEQAATGQTSLRIVDTSTAKGSDVLSARMSLRPDTDYELRGNAYLVSGEGVGVYVRLYDRQEAKLPPRHA